MRPLSLPDTRDSLSRCSPSPALAGPALSRAASRLCRHLVFGIALVLLWAPPILAHQIGSSDFTAAAKIESFEDLNRPHSAIANVNLPTPFTFPSGVSLTQPNPNSRDSFGVFIVDGGGFFGYLTDARIPDGTAYMGLASPFANHIIIEFTFPQGIRRAGAFVASAQGSQASAPVTVTAYGNLGQPLEQTVTSGVTVDGWRSNFIGFEESQDIRQLTFVGTDGVVRLDALKFETPEPATLGLVAVAAGCLLARRRAQRA